MSLKKDLKDRHNMPNSVPAGKPVYLLYPTNSNSGEQVQYLVPASSGPGLPPLNLKSVETSEICSRLHLPLVAKTESDLLSVNAPPQFKQQSDLIMLQEPNHVGIPASDIDIDLLSNYEWCQNMTQGLTPYQIEEQNVFRIPQNSIASVVDEESSVSKFAIEGVSSTKEYFQNANLKKAIQHDTTTNHLKAINMAPYFMNFELNSQTKNDEIIHVSLKNTPNPVHTGKLVSPLTSNSDNQIHYLVSSNSELELLPLYIKSVETAENNSRPHLPFIVKTEPNLLSISSAPQFEQESNLVMPQEPNRPSLTQIDSSIQTKPIPKVYITSAHDTTSGTLLYQWDQNMKGFRPYQIGEQRKGFHENVFRAPHTTVTNEVTTFENTNYRQESDITSHKWSLNNTNFKTVQNSANIGETALTAAEPNENGEVANDESVVYIVYPWDGVNILDQGQPNEVFPLASSNSQPFIPESGQSDFLVIVQSDSDSSSQADNMLAPPHLEPKPVIPRRPKQRCNSFVKDTPSDRLNKNPIKVLPSRCECRFLDFQSRGFLGFTNLEKRKSYCLKKVRELLAKEESSIKERTKKLRSGRTYVQNSISARNYYSFPEIIKIHPDDVIDLTDDTERLPTIAELAAQMSEEVSRMNKIDTHVSSLSNTEEGCYLIMRGLEMIQNSSQRNLPGNRKNWIIGGVKKD